MDTIEQRVMKLESAREIDRVHILAIRHILFQTIYALQETKILPLSVLTTKLESGTAFAQGAFDSHPSELLKALTASLKEVQAAYEAHDPPQ